MSFTGAADYRLAWLYVFPSKFTVCVCSAVLHLSFAHKDLAEYEILRDGLLERLAVLSSTVSSAGGGWRYQLMASWCLLHLIRSGGPSTRSGLSVDASRLGPPSMEVWQWFADCLCKGDGQPLQRLALGAFGRLLSTVGVDGDGNREEVTALLLSRKFLRSLIRALARNHKKQATEAGAPGAEQWSLGVKEILIDAGRGDTRELVRCLVLVSSAVTSNTCSMNTA